jgi:hypothetical protein
MTVNAATGVVSWNPTVDDVDRLVRSRSSRRRNGGEAEQEFLIYVHPTIGNNPPIIVSEPGTTFELPDLNVNDPLGSVTPDRIDIGLLPGEAGTHTVTLDLPADAFSADIVVVVDLSSSMFLELPQIDNVTDALNDALEARGITNNRFSLVGFLGDGRVYAATPEPFKVSFYGPDNELVRSVYVPDMNSGTIYLDDFELPDDGEYVVIVSRDRGETIESEEYRFVVEEVETTIQTASLTIGNFTQAQSSVW